MVMVSGHKKSCWRKVVVVNRVPLYVRLGLPNWTEKYTIAGRYRRAQNI